MSDPIISRSTRRARWLAELAAALEEAHELTLLTAKWRDGDPEAVALRSRLKAAMAEVEALRRGLTGGATEIDPKRFGYHLPSRRSPPDRSQR